MKPELLIRAGLIAAKTWDIDPANVHIMLVPEIAGTQIIVSKSIQDDYISIKREEEVVYLQRWRHTEGWEIWMAYSELCQTLVVRSMEIL